MKEAILLLILLLLSTMASAATTPDTAVIYTGTVEPYNHYKTTEKEDFTVEILDEQAKVIIHLPGLSMSAANNSCSYNGDFRFCVSDIAFSRYNYTLPSRMAYKAKIDLTAEIGILVLNRTIWPAKLYAGERANVTILIKNTGLADAYNITYEDNVSNFFDVFQLSLSDCEYKEGLLKWNGAIAPGKSIKCSALLQGKKAGTGPAEAKLNYYTRTLKKTATNTLPITVKESPLKINYTGSTKLGVGLGTTLRFNITSLENSTSSSFLINVSPALLVKGSNGLEQTAPKSFYLAVDLQQGKSKFFDLTLVPSTSGLHEIRIDYRVLFNSMILTYSMIPVINATISQMQPSILNPNLSEGNTILGVLLNNPSNFSFYNVTVQAGSPVSREISLAGVEAYGHKTAELPFAAKAGSANVTIKITYYSEYNEKFEKIFNKKISISGTPAKKETSVKQQPQTKARQESFVQKYSGYAKYVAIAGIIMVILAIITWVIRHRNQEKLLGA